MAECLPGCVNEACSPLQAMAGSSCTDKDSTQSLSLHFSQATSNSTTILHLLAYRLLTWVGSLTGPTTSAPVSLATSRICCEAASMEGTWKDLSLIRIRCWVGAACAERRQ